MWWVFSGSGVVGSGVVSSAVVGSAVVASGVVGSGVGSSVDVREVSVVGDGTKFVVVCGIVALSSKEKV